VVSQEKLRRQYAAIMSAVAAGETFVVTRDGTPIAELRPATPRRRAYATRADLAASVTPGGPVDTDLRADLDQVIDPWL
jgi:antitoxin (DNA-binding transcriptional repressor) of toxin-antitoxin stability system